MKKLLIGQEETTPNATPCPLKAFKWLESHWVRDFQPVLKQDRYSQTAWKWRGKYHKINLAKYTVHCKNLAQVPKTNPIENPSVCACPSWIHNTLKRRKDCVYGKANRSWERKSHHSEMGALYNWIDTPTSSQLSVHWCTRTWPRPCWQHKDFCLLLLHLSKANDTIQNSLQC